ncbi:High osmolarity signaling protein SHO1 [Smittium culicis]|uniref:High osmolarity signaling protein SHO1 n=1 Tax=Smittium culicis TaxID=133412 RepID=A0A1R1YCS4_9FUNG|nr:High osmolarity signaling protein SHO1 [Smittium culicis]
MVVQFVGLISWIVIFGKTNDFTEWGITNSSLLRSTTIKSNESSQLGSFDDKDVRSQSFNIPAVLRAVALYSYDANDDDPTEMSFIKGEILDVLDCNGKWWQARRADGSIGIVPSNYFKVLDE